MATDITHSFPSLTAMHPAKIDFVNFPRLPAKEGTKLWRTAWLDSTR